MPKVAPTSKDVIAAMIQDGMDEDGAEPRDIATTPAPVAYQPEPAPMAVAPVAPAAPQMDLAALVQMLAQAMQQSGLSTAQAIKEGLADAATMAREPIPENKQDPGISVYSHPEGDLKRPRTKLRCPMYLGYYDEDGKIIPAFEYLEGTTTERERVAMNRLSQGTYTVTRNDEEVGLVRVHEQTDSLGQPVRLVIAPPFVWLQKETFAQMPSLVRMLDQMLTAQSAAA